MKRVLPIAAAFAVILGLSSATADAPPRLSRHQAERAATWSVGSFAELARGTLRVDDCAKLADNRRVCAVSVLGNGKCQMSVHVVLERADIYRIWIRNVKCRLS